MSIDITIPDPGESISEVQIGQWYKSAGDPVDKDETIVEIETDKASMEVPAPVTGTLSKITKKSGDTAQVGEVIGRMESRADDSEQDMDASDEDQAPSAVDSEQQSKRKPDKNTGTPQTQQTTEKDNASGSDETDKADAGQGPRIDEQVEVKPRIMPPAKQALSRHGVRPSDVEGTGPGGRILKKDVIRHLKEGPARTRQSGVTSDDRREEVVTMSPWRQRVAKQLVESQRHATTSTTIDEIDMTAVKDLRRRYDAVFNETTDPRHGLLPFFVKASVEALKDAPVLNASLQGEHVVYRHHFDIGVAVPTDYGLAVPVIRDAGSLDFSAIDGTIADFAARGQAKTLMPDELEDGTFTITDRGTYAALLSSPVVHLPQTATLGLHAVQDRLIVLEGELVIRPMMYVALSYDHRIVDERDAITFLKRVKRQVEDPGDMLLRM